MAQNPQQNVELQANDVIYVSHEPRYFLAMGAIGQGASIGLLNRRFPFEDSHIMLADAVAKAGGLQDDRANASGVFVYRMEPRATILALGVDPHAQLPDRPVVLKGPLAGDRGWLAGPARGKVVCDTNKLAPNRSR